MINKRGQTSLAIAVIAAIFLFMIGSMVIEIIKPEITTFRSVENFDCTNSTISDGAKMTCLGMDLLIPYFFLLIISISGGVIINKFVK